MATNIAQSGLGPGGVGRWRIEVDFNPSNGRVTAPVRVVVESGNFYVWSKVVLNDGSLYERTYGQGPGTMQQPVPTGSVRVVADGEGGYSYSPITTWMAEAQVTPAPDAIVVGPA